MINSLDEAIKHEEEVAKELEEELVREFCDDTELMDKCLKCANEHRQLAEWLKELNTYREFADWLVEAVLKEDWEESADFYAEVLCRKLTKLGKLKVVDNKYMEVKADADN